MLIHSAEITGSVQFNNTDVSGITNVAGFATTASVNTLIIRTGSYATTGSNQFNGNQSISGSITSNGTITAQTLVVQTVTSSIEFVTGSTRNGSLLTNTHQFTGSVGITGSAAALLNVNNDVLYISSSGNIGIGTTSPVAQLEVSNSLATKTAIKGGSIELQSYAVNNAWVGENMYFDGDWRIRSTGYGNQIYFGNGTFNFVRFPTTGSGAIVTPTSSLYINNTGYVGIGATSPSKALTVYSPTTNNTAQVRLYGGFSTDNRSLYLGSFANTGYISMGGTYTGGWASDISTTAIAQITMDSTSGDSNIAFATSTTNNAGPSERMRITSGGSVCIGTTTNIGSGLISMQGSSAVYNFLAIKDTYTGPFNDVWYAFFLNDSGARAGGIQHTASTTVSFVTSSDYRLKEDFKQIKGLETLLKIKPYNFKFKDEDFRMDGVIAHELQEVLPYAVTGNKDGKDMQGVDYSKIVPVLVKAIQELKAEIDILKQQ